jgi:hypothetical protein
VLVLLYRDSVGELETNLRSNLEDERDTQVGGILALLSGPLPYGNVMRSDVYLLPDPNTGLAVAVAGPEDVDTLTAAQGLAELVATRLDRIPPP